MTKNEFDDLDSLFEAIENDIKESMNNEVAEEMRDEHIEQLDKFVYDSYEPSQWSQRNVPRREGNGGLKDRANMITTFNEKNNIIEMEFRNVTEGRTSPPVSYTDGTYAPNYLLGIIEYGRTGANKGLYTHVDEADIFLRPRSVMGETFKNIESKDIVYKGMKKGMKKRGYNVE